MTTSSRSRGIVQVCRLSSVLLFMCLSCTRPSTVPAVSDSAILIFNVNIINVLDGSISQDQYLVIDSGFIKAVGPYSTLGGVIPAGHQIDGGHRYAIPGLWDMHVHMEGTDLVEDNEALLPLYVAYGITTVRDCASDLGEKVLEWRNEINQGKLFGPRIFTAGKKLEGINSIWKGDLEIANEADLKMMLDTLESYRVDFIKITENTLPGELFLKSVKEAKRRKFIVSGHVPLDITIQELAEGGLSSIEHASYLLRLGGDEAATISQLDAGRITHDQANENYFLNFDQARAIHAYGELAKTGIAVTPTLIGGKQLAFLDEDDHQHDAFLSYLSKRFTSKYQWRIDRMAGDTPEQRKQRKDRYSLIAAQVPLLQKAGILLLAGSDAAALNTFVYPAQSLHEELVLFQDAGLTPLEILQTATTNGAKFMGKLDSIGTIKTGSVADIILLDRNPLEDIRATQSIYAVINKGQYLGRPSLDSILQQVVRRRIALDSLRKE